MGRISEAFVRSERLLIPFFTLGDPDVATTVELVLEAARRGADVVELGIPYSDPVADGPTIQAASQRALARGTRLSDVFEAVRAIRQRSDVPLVIFSYCNPVYRLGPSRFLAQMAEAGADGLLCPDLPVEEADEIAMAAARKDLDQVFLVSPTTTPARLARIATASRGFLYLVARIGVTGASADLAMNLAEDVRRVQDVSPVPVAVGFGVGSREQAEAIYAMGADAVVVGSALVAKVAEWASQTDLVLRVGELVASWKGAPRPVR